MPQVPVSTTLFVSQLVAGTGITLSPTAGSGIVTISASDAAEFASPPALGNVAPNAVHATTLSATGAVTGAGVTALFASPPAIGGTAAGAIHATTLDASGAVTGAGFTAAFLAWFQTNSGTFTANGASAVTVAAASVTASSIILITLKTVGGTVGAVPAVKTITPTTGFTVAATASDTSVYNYVVIG